MATTAQVDFLLTDAQVGRTFARMALEAPPGSARRQRQGSLARAAYDAVVYHSEQVCLSAVDQERLDVALEDLRIALGRLAHPTPRTPPP